MSINKSSHKERFKCVIEYIESNLDSDLDVDKLCQIAHLSKYHFHRQCSAFFGISVISLVRLLRLKRAAFQIAYRRESIINIALANGYDSHEAFSRAFKKYFGRSPSDFRRVSDWNPWHKKYEPIITLRKKIMTEQVNFDVEVVHFPETLVAVKEHRGAPSLLGDTIKEFITWRKINKLPPTSSRTFNLLYDDPNLTKPEDYRFDLCCSIDNTVRANNHGVETKTIQAGQCAKIRHIGSDDAIGVVVEFLYAKWLTCSEFEVRDFPIFFERVIFYPEVPENQMVTDIYLPIQ